MGAEVELMFGTAIKKAMILKDSLFEVVILWDMFKTQIISNIRTISRWRFAV
jgi:hypothetical protein